jgi:hypothetical protein
MVFAEIFQLVKAYPDFPKELSPFLPNLTQCVVVMLELSWRQVQSVQSTFQYKFLNSPTLFLTEFSPALLDFLWNQSEITHNIFLRTFKDTFMAL